MSVSTVHDKHDIVEPSDSIRTEFQFDTTIRDWPSGGLEVGSEFDIAVNGNTQRKLFFDDLRGMLSVDEKLRKRTSSNKRSALVGKVVRILEEGRIIQINIKGKGSNTNTNVFDYLKLEPCHNDCEFSMDQRLSSPAGKNEFQIEIIK